MLKGAITKIHQKCRIYFELRVGGKFKYVMSESPHFKILIKLELRVASSPIECKILTIVKFLDTNGSYL